MQNLLTRTDNWVFDLDNTLYPPESKLHELMDLRIRGYVARSLNLPDDEAHIIQKGYFRSHGTTLAGLMANHGVDPHDYLADVHDFPLDRLAAAPRLAGQLSRLPGRKLIFTNADAPYAGRVLSALGLDGIFDLIVDIHACGYQPKPDASAYETLFRESGIDPARSVFVEDMARNLAPAKAHGMTTVWLNNGSELGTVTSDAEHIDYEASSLADWLSDVIEAQQFQSQP